MGCFKTVFRYHSENSRHIKVAPGIYLHFCNLLKNLSVCCLPEDEKMQASAVKTFPNIHLLQEIMETKNIAILQFSVFY